nr:DUF6491 family protein [uncultured Sphingorhabdus sp.]
MMKNTMCSLLVAAAIAVPAQSKKPEPHVWPEVGVETKINFPNQGAIRNFEADGNDGIWLEDRQRRWYYAEVLGGCQELNFAQAIGFDTRGSATFDKFSTIIVAGDKCQVASLVTANKPLPRKERQMLRKQALAAGRDVAAPSN